MSQGKLSHLAVLFSHHIPSCADHVTAAALATIVSPRKTLQRTLCFMAWQHMIAHGRVRAVQPNPNPRTVLDFFGVDTFSIQLRRINMPQVAHSCMMLHVHVDMRPTLLTACSLRRAAAIARFRSFKAATILKLAAANTKTTSRCGPHQKFACLAAPATKHCSS